MKHEEIDNKNNENENNIVINEDNENASVRH